VKSTIVLTALSMNTVRRPWVFSEVDGLYHSGVGFALASKIATIEGRRLLDLIRTEVLGTTNSTVSRSTPHSSCPSVPICDTARTT
jgi:hypothetical protein